MNFIKTFLAGLLAVVVGTFLVFFLWIFILLGIAGSMEKSVAVHPESILKIDFSEVLTDAPSSDPLAGLDLMTLQTQRQLPLLKALRALEAARDDDRIKGIYLRMNGTGGVTGSAILEELREALQDSGRAASSSSPITKPTARGDTIWHRSPTRSTWSLTEGCSGQVFLRR